MSLLNEFCSLLVSVFAIVSLCLLLLDALSKKSRFFQTSIRNSLLVLATTCIDAFKVFQLWSYFSLFIHPLFCLKLFSVILNVLFMYLWFRIGIDNVYFFIVDVNVLPFYSSTFVFWMYGIIYFQLFCYVLFMCLWFGIGIDNCVLC